MAEGRGRRRLTPGTIVNWKFEAVERLTYVRTNHWRNSNDF